MQFFYPRVPEVFLAREGWGPLRAGLDTSILIDLAENGPELVEAAGAFIAPEEWDERVPALRDLLALWIWRDIRFHVSPDQMEDARKALSPHRRERRERILDAFATETWERENWGDDPAPYHLPTAVIRGGVDFIRPEMDRRLVQDALAAGCHVLLTEDHDDILSRRRDLRCLGLVALRPCELLDELLLAGELEPERCFGHVWPDNHGWVHLFEALG